jgi:hypothetical protein
VASVPRVGEDGAVDGGDVLRAAGECQALLGAAVDRDWTAKLPHLDFTVAGAVTHMAEGTLWYATDLAAGPQRLDTMELRVPPETAPAELVRTICAFANGRIDLPGRERQVDWRWQCAPSRSGTASTRPAAADPGPPLVLEHGADELVPRDP